MSRAGGNSWWRPTRVARRSTGPGTTPPACAWRVPRSVVPRRSPVPPDWPWRAAGDSCTRRRSARSPGPPIRTPGRCARSRSARATGRPPCPCWPRSRSTCGVLTPGSPGRPRRSPLHERLHGRPEHDPAAGDEAGRHARDRRAGAGALPRGCVDAGDVRGGVRAAALPPALPGGRGRDRAGRVRGDDVHRRVAGRRGDAGGEPGPVGRGDRHGAADGAGRRGGQTRLRGGLARGARGQPQGQAAVPAPWLHRGRDQARLLPAVRRRRRGHAEGAAVMVSPLVLGIETSCDETGIGLVRGHDLLADAVASSVDEHARFGGVVPEVASRAHLEAMIPTFDRALATAGVRPGQIDAVAVTAGPGLAGALLVGVRAAQALSFALRKPLYGVNHLAAHIAVDQLEHGTLPAPAVALLVSGGHSSLLLVPDVTQEVISLGATIDDAAGEAYDKVARVLGMPFPGGPPIDKAARDGDPAAISFPRGKYHDGTLDFSFAGLKTAVARWVEARQAAGQPVHAPDVAASFQEAVADVLTRKAVQACQRHDVTDLIIGGGVAANSRLRSLGAERCDAAGIKLRVPRPGLCTDNGAMVAALGAEIVSRGLEPSPLDLPADSSLPVTEVVVR